jgi:ferredoxin-type protein NapH
MNILTGLKNNLRKIILTIIFLIILIGGWFEPLLGFFVPVCMVAGIGSSFFYGKTWCSKACPRGGFYDLCSGCTCKNRPNRFYSDDKFKLAVLCILMIAMSIGLYLNWPSVTNIGHFFVILLTVTTVIGVILGFFYNSRIWCYFCPIGSLSGWISQALKSTKSK